jgi:hypothetical protein
MAIPGSEPVLAPLNLQDTTSAANINTTIDAFQAQNMSPSDISSLSGSIPQTIGGIPGLGSRIPSLAKIPTPFAELPGILSPITSAKFGVKGAWESVHYADDLNAHYPKFKFLFKVGFYGFPGGDSFEYFVHRVDKPRVKFNHTDVNYYNFRTRVLTSVTYEPLAIQFLDEVTNTVFNFFKGYLEATSGTGKGNYGIDIGWGKASSTIPYKDAYSHFKGQKIILEQIFVDPTKGQGPESNRFVFMNPRIESFEFDDLTHEETAGSMANITFSYDAIHVETQNKTTIHSWGQTDLFKAGGTSGLTNGGDNSGASMYSDKNPAVKQPAPSIYDSLRKGSDLIQNIPTALGGLVSQAGTAISGSSLGQAVSSAGDTVSKNISETLDSISTGMNLTNAGGTATTNQTVTPTALPSTNTGQTGP